MPVSKSQAHKKSWGAQVQHGVARKENLGNTNTPMDVARMIVQGCVPQYALQGRILEPCVGAGNFYLAVLEHAQTLGLDPFDVAQRFDAFDIDPDAIAVVKTRTQERFGWTKDMVDGLPIKVKNFVDVPSQPLYQLIITNPPYLSTRNWGQNEQERVTMQQAWRRLVPQADARADLYVYFFHHAHQCLIDNGLSVFLCADGWLDASYGASMREEFLSTMALVGVRSWPWKALFRDDTCPIVTLVEKKAPSTTLLRIDDRDPLLDQPCYTGGEHVFEETLSLTDMKEWFSSTTPNRRQRVLLPPDFYRALQDVQHDLHKKGATLGAMTTLSGFSWSMQDLERAGLVHPPLSAPASNPTASPTSLLTDGGTANTQHVPVFFQKQARVGKPVDYRQFRATSSLAHTLVLGADKLSQKVLKHGARLGGVWISQAIDRFPLVFAQDPKDVALAWYGVSKYLHAATPSPDILCAIMTSTPALLSLEWTLKEGTRKTLRVNENGFAKEITKQDLQQLWLPNPSNWNATSRKTIQEQQSIKGLRSLTRVDDAVAVPQWQVIDQTIMTELGWDQPKQQALQALALALYWRRMRNVLEYGAAQKKAFDLLLAIHMK